MGVVVDLLLECFDWYVCSWFDVTILLSLLIKIISFYSSRLETRTKECIKVKSIMV